MHVDVLCKGLVVGIENGLVVHGAGSAEVVHQNIDAPLIFHHRVYHLQDAFLVVCLEVYGLDIIALGIQGCGFLRTSFQVAAGHVYSGPGLGQGLHA